MAKIFLEVDETNVNIANNGDEVFGQQGDENVVIMPGVTGVVLDGNVEGVTLDGNLADYEFQQQGNQLLVYSGGVLVATIPVQVDEDGTQLTFGDGTFTAEFGDGAVLNIDGEDVPSGEPGPVVPEPDAPFLTINDVTVTEGDSGTTTATFTVTLSEAPGASESVTVDYATADGTATAGTDYVAATGTLTFAEGETTKTIEVTVNGDTSDEEDETYNVELTNVTGTIGGEAVVISDGTGVGTITDDDASVASYSLAAAATSVTEGNDIVFTATALDADGNAVAVTEDTTFNYQIAGVEVAGGTASPATDLGKVTGTVTILAGQSTGTFTLSPIDDGVTEGFEGFNVSLLDSSFQAVATSGNVVIQDGANAGQTFTLTTGIDQGSAFTGTSGNDTFLADNTVTTVTNAADSIDGGAGTDTLKVWGFASGDAIPQTAKIENLVLDSTADGADVNLGNFSGVTNVTISRDGGTNAYTVGSGQSVTLENFAVDAGTADNLADLSLTYAAAATSATINLNAITVTTAGTPANSDVEIVGSGLTAITLNTTGAASTIQNLLTPATVVTMNVTGDKDLTITEGLDTETTKVDATNFTGKLSVVGADVAQTVNGGSNDDTVDLRAESTAKTMTVSLGAGNDTLKLTAANYTADDVLAGGDGTDTLTLAIANSNTFNTDVSAKTTGFDVLEVVTDSGGSKSATLNVGATKLGVTSLKASATTSTDTINFTGLQAASTITVAADVAVMSAALETATGTADVLNVALGGTAGGIDVGTSFTAADIETINIASTGATTKNTITSLVTDSAKSVVVTGSGEGLDLTLTDIVNGTTTFDAAGYSGALTLVADTASEQLKSVTAGSGDDTVTVGAGTLAQGFTAVGGDGTDKLVATASPDQNLGILAVSAFETIELTSNTSSGDTVTADFRNVTGLNTLKLTAGDNADVFVLNNFGTATIAADNDTVGEINIESSQTSTSLKLGGSGTGNTTVTTLTMDAGATTLNVESASDTSTITNIAGTSLTTINVTGAGATDIDDNPLPSGVNSIDGSAATGALSATLAAAGTLKGGSAGDTLGGSSGADTINAGAGDDAITGGAGADAINVGTGTDTVVQGAADDSGNFTTPAGNSISTTNFDIITGFAAGDKIDIDQDATSGAVTAANATSLAGVSVADGAAVLVRGTYDATAGTFVGSATGADSLLAYDADGTDAVQDIEAIVLVGYQGNLASSDPTGIFTLA